MEQGEDDLSGSIDAVFSKLRQRLPTIRIERLQVAHLGDDDNLWFITCAPADTGPEVQIEAHPNGCPPFLIEGASPGERLETAEAEEAVNVILHWLSAKC